MYKLLNIIVALLFLAFQTGQSYAGSSTANATAGTGDYVYSVITDAGGHFIGRFGLCDGTAAASCATVTAGAISTSITGAIPAGTNVIGHVITDSTSTTAVTQATAANLNATIVGTGTFAVQAAQSGTWNIGTVTTVTGVTTVSTLTSITNPVAVTQSGTWNITNISGTISLPTGAATSANQTNASAKTQIVDGSGNVIASTSNNLNVQCANCSGSGASAVDAATFTAGTSVFAPAGGQFGSATACVTGHQCMVGMTAARAFLTDTSSIAGNTTLTGNGTTGTGSQRVTIASDNTAFSVNAVQSGTWNINNISGTVSLPTGAATSALQPTNAAQGSTTSGQTGPMVQGAVTTTAPTYTTAQTSPLSLDTAGNLRVVGTGLAQGSTTSGQTGSMVMAAVTTGSPTYTTAQTSPLSVDTSGSLRVAIISGAGSGGTAIQDNAAFTTGTTNETPIGCYAGTPTATANHSTIVACTTGGSIHTTIDNTAVPANISQVLGSAISATNGLFANQLQGNAVLSVSNPSFARVVAGATGGSSTTGNIAAANTTAVVVKGSAGTLYGVQVYGIGSAPAYLKIYNATSATCGSGTPVKRIMIPAASTAANGAGSNVTFGDLGVAFGTGITYCVTTGITDADTSAPAASTFLINIDWN